MSRRPRDDREAYRRGSPMRHQENYDYYDDPRRRSTSPSRDHRDAPESNFGYRNPPPRQDDFSRRGGNPYDEFAAGRRPVTPRRMRREEEEEQRASRYPRRGDDGRSGHTPGRSAQRFGPREDDRSAGRRAEPMDDRYALTPRQRGGNVDTTMAHRPTTAASPGHRGEQQLAIKYQDTPTPRKSLPPSRHGDDDDYYQTPASRRQPQPRSRSRSPGGYRDSDRTPSQQSTRHQRQHPEDPQSRMDSYVDDPSFQRNGRESAGDEKLDTGPRAGLAVSALLALVATALIVAATAPDTVWFKTEHRWNATTPMVATEVSLWEDQSTNRIVRCDGSGQQTITNADEDSKTNRGVVSLRIFTIIGVVAGIVSVLAPCAFAANAKRSSGRSTGLLLGLTLPIVLLLASGMVCVLVTYLTFARGDDSLLDSYCPCIAPAGSVYAEHCGTSIGDGPVYAMVSCGISVLAACASGAVLVSARKAIDATSDPNSDDQDLQRGDRFGRHDALDVTNDPQYDADDASLPKKYVPRDRDIDDSYDGMYSSRKPRRYQDDSGSSTQQDYSGRRPVAPPKPKISAERDVRAGRALPADEDPTPARIKNSPQQRSKSRDAQKPRGQSSLQTSPSWLRREADDNASARRPPQSIGTSLAEREEIDTASAVSLQELSDDEHAVVHRGPVANGATGNDSFFVDGQAIPQDDLDAAVGSGGPLLVEEVTSADDLMIPPSCVKDSENGGVIEVNDWRIVHTRAGETVFYSATLGHYYDPTDGSLFEDEVDQEPDYL